MKTTQISTFAILFLFATAIFSQSCKTDDDDITSTDGSATEYVESGNQITIIDHGDGTGDKTLTADKVWVLDGMVFVNSGSTLTIEPGTVIKGKPGEGENASALIVAKGATINAEGTAQDPIISLL